MLSEEEKQERIQKIQLMQQQWLRKYGFYIHYTFFTTRSDYMNSHTHGIPDNFNHRDLQIVLPISDQLVSALFHTAVDQIKQGIRFEDSTRYRSIIEGFAVLCKQYREGDRNVIRLILPDPNGLFPEDPGCDEHYRKQIDELDPSWK